MGRHAVHLMVFVGGQGVMGQRGGVAVLIDDAIRGAEGDRVTGDAHAITVNVTAPHDVLEAQDPAAAAVSVECLDRAGSGQGERQAGAVGHPHRLAEGGLRHDHIADGVGVVSAGAGGDLNARDGRGGLRPRARRKQPCQQAKAKRPLPSGLGRRPSGGAHGSTRWRSQHGKLACGGSARSRGAPIMAMRALESRKSEQPIHRQSPTSAGASPRRGRNPAVACIAPSECPSCSSG